MQISAAAVKELRERSGAGMMECKNALVATNGDIEAALEHLRKSGAAKAASTVSERYGVPTIAASRIRSSRASSRSL